MGALAIFASMKTWPWRLILCISVAMLVFGALYFFGKHLYALGARDERDVWENRVDRMEDQSQDLGREAGRAQHEAANRIGEALEAESEQLESMINADDETFLRAWAASDRRLLDSAASAGGDRRA